MSSDWSYAKFGELTVNLDKRRKAVKEPDRKPGPYPYYGASGVVDYVDGYLFEGPHLLIAEDGENLRTRQTPIAFMADGKFWVNNHAHIVVGNEKASTRFLLYALLGADISAYLSGAVMPKLTQANLNRIEVPCPPRNLQDQIVEILGTLDDRITLLRETNKTLESIAQAIFKSWFVDFDPVRAKMEGRQPEGMDEDTAALFPDSFEESELGLVPRGWNVGSLADFAVLNPESWTAKKHPKTISYVDLANTKDNEIAAVTEFAFDEAPSRARRVLRAGDTIVGTVRPGNRSFAFIYEPTNNLTASTGFAVLRPIAAENTEFVYLAATQETSIEHLSHVADGGAYPAVRPEVVLALSCIVPCRSVLQQFHAIATALLAQVAENQQQTQTISILRDTLLPRLISGQLRLPEAQEQIEAALS